MFFKMPLSFFFRSAAAGISLLALTPISPADSQCLTPGSRAAAMQAQAGPDTSKWPEKPWPAGMVWIPGGEFDMGGVGPEAR
jgi:formylglycine-generating enzyme required for sulfatase activity